MVYIGKEDTIRSITGIGFWFYTYNLGIMLYLYSVAYTSGPQNVLRESDVWDPAVNTSKLNQIQYCIVMVVMIFFLSNLTPIRAPRRKKF